MANEIETRQFVRFRSATDTHVTMRVENGRSFQAELIDVNRSGGMGLMLAYGAPTLFLRDLFEPLEIRRRTTDREIVSIMVYVLGIVPAARRGARLSAVSSLETLRKYAGAPARRRGSRRIPVAPRVVILDREGHEFRASMTNFSSDDGVGLVIPEKDVPGDITIEHLLVKPWVLSHNNMPHVCQIQRIGAIEGKLILGAQAPEIVRVLGSQKDSDGSAVSEQHAEDDMLLEMLARAAAAERD